MTDNGGSRRLPGYNNYDTYITATVLLLPIILKYIVCITNGLMLILIAIENKVCKERSESARRTDTPRYRLEDKWCEWVWMGKSRDDPAPTHTPNLIDPLSPSILLLRVRSNFD
jgi:hypothetical protein